MMWITFKELITLAFLMCSLIVRFTVKCVFDGIYNVLSTSNDVKNTIDSETHIQTAHPKRKCNRPQSNLRKQEDDSSNLPQLEPN
jgi:hypothetical protein